MITLPLYDIDYDEMATFVNVSIKENTGIVYKTLIVDLSSYMTIIFDQSITEGDNIYYRYPTPLKSKHKLTKLSLNGYRGMQDQDNPQLENFTVELEVFFASLPEDKKLNFDGVLGIASFTNENDETNKSIMKRSLIQQLVKNGIVGSESFMLNSVWFNDTTTQYESSITFGYNKANGTEEYLLNNNSIPILSQDSYDGNKSYQIVKMDVGLKEIDILSYFDISELEDTAQKGELYKEVIIDSAVPYIQLPDPIFKYFHNTFFNDNCITQEKYEVSTCG